MNNLIKYLQDSFSPRDTTEFVTLPKFDQTTFDDLRQDGFMVVESSDEKLDLSIDHVTIGDYTLIRKNSPKQIEWLNEDGGTSFDLSREPMYRRMVPPPWETLDHQSIIANVIQHTNGKNKSYIEYGVRDGACIEKIAPHVGYAYGVDMDPYETKTENVRMFTMTTDQFSIRYLPTIKFDYAFIDADHTSKQVVIDFDYIINLINDNGYVFLHDTYPCRVENLLPSACNDCYKSPLKIKEKYPELEILTLPINPGLTIIRKRV